MTSLYYLIIITNTLAKIKYHNLILGMNNKLNKVHRYVCLSINNTPLKDDQYCL